MARRIMKELNLNNYKSIDVKSIFDILLTKY